MRPLHRGRPFGVEPEVGDGVLKGVFTGVDGAEQALVFQHHDCA